MGWLTKNFSLQDFLVVKMDIEGAEFEILEKPLSMRCSSLIDVLLWECHARVAPKGQDCKTLESMLSDRGTRVLTEGNDYEGFRSTIV